MPSFPSITPSVAPTDPDSEVRLQVEVREEFWERSPARVAVRLTDMGKAGRRLVTGRTSGPFGPLRSTEQPTESPLHLTPCYHVYDEESIPDSPLNGCWRLVSGYTLYENGIVWLTDYQETIEQEFVVLADQPASVEECLQPGNYQFILEIEEDDKTASYSLAFMLALGER